MANLPHTVQKITTCMLETINGPVWNVKGKDPLVFICQMKYAEEKTYMTVDRHEHIKLQFSVLR